MKNMQSFSAGSNPSYNALDLIYLFILLSLCQLFDLLLWKQQFFGESLTGSSEGFSPKGRTLDQHFISFFLRAAAAKI